MSTTPFSRDERERDPLLRQVAALPRDVKPERDLWSGIRAEIEKPVARTARAGRSETARLMRWPMALAAGFAVAAVSAILTWSVMRTPDAPPAQMASTAPAAPLDIQPVAYGPNSRLSPQYLETRAQLLRQFEQRVGEMPPDVRAKVLGNLEVIRKAAAEIDSALAEDPSSQLLNQMLLSTYQDEIKLYSTVANTARRPDLRT